MMADQTGDEHNEVQTPAGHIKAIDRGSVHKICSGQVVLTLATAVKELVENSVDARATSVEVKLKEYGSEMIEVNDNGSGVKESNFEGLTLKHHTSKLQEFTDLINVETFGFRGEALSSLCALSQLNVTTRHETVSVGYKLEFDYHGKLVNQTPCARQVGTSVCLQNLFSTLPVRHKEFQRNLKKEFSKMIQVLNAYCIISTGVRINCTNQLGKGKRTTVVSTNGNNTMRENIANIFGAKQLQSLLEFEQISPSDDICEELGLKIPEQFHIIYKVTGFVSSCCHGSGRSSTDRQFYFINHRPCDPTKVSKMVNEVYHSYNRHQYPFAALNIQLNKDHVDVNVTPDKRQIFVQEEKLLLAIIKSSLIKMFEPIHAVYQVNTGLGKSNVTLTSLFRRNDSTPNPNEKIQISSTDSPSLNGTNNSPKISTLSRLKRSFTSAFAKDEEEDSSKSSTPSKQPNKQRRLESFLSEKSPVRDTSSQNNSYSSTGEITPGESGFYSSQEVLTDSSPKYSQQLTKNVSITFEEHQSENVNSIKDKQISITENTDCRLKSVKSPKDVFSEEVIFSNNKISEESNANNDSPIFKTELSADDGLPSEIKNNIGERIDLVSSFDSHKSVRHSDAVCELDLEDRLSNHRETREHNSGEVTLNHAENKVREDDIHRNSPLSVTLLNYDNPEKRKKKEQSVKFSIEKLRQQMKRSNKQKEETTEEFHRGFRAKIAPSDNQSAEDELQREIRKEMFSEMEILGQFNLGFIVARLKDDLFIIDQHATDEKYNFEMLQKNTVIQSQRMICPLNLELTASNEVILIDNLGIFKKNGFDFNIDEEAPPTQRIKLSSTPMSKNWTFGKEDIEEMLFMLSESPGVSCRPSRIRQMFASRSCRKAIMIGTALDKAQMKTLVNHMGEIEQPWNCPHGRPTMRHLINLKMIER